MDKHSVVFIDLPEYERLDKPTNRPRNYNINHLKALVRELPKRICLSFLPPIFGSRSRVIYVDFLGPLLAVVTLSFLLQSGHNNKHPHAALSTPPLLILGVYLVLFPVLCLALGRIGNSTVKLRQIAALLGYGLYGHIATLFGSQLFGGTTSDATFFALLILFGGLTALKIAIVFLVSIPKPAARLLVCSTVVLVHLLFLVFLHYAYVHRTFVYKGQITVSNKL